MVALIFSSTSCGSLESPLSGPSRHPPVQKPSMPSLAPRLLQKGKTHLPQNLLPLQKRGFPLLSKLSMEVIQATWKTSVAALFGLYVGKIISHGDSMILPWLVFRNKGDCVCVYVRCTRLCFCTLDALWGNVSISIAFLNITFAS